jgi:hypothetical protein
VQGPRCYFGYPASVLTDGSDSGDVPLHEEAWVVGWRAGCECGWRSELFYPRSEWPSLTGRVPPAIEGSETRTGMFAEWSRHLDREVPELAVLDYAQQLDEVTTRLTDAVRTARRAGVLWQRIGEVSGMSAGQAAHCWDGRPTHLVGHAGGSAVTETVYRKQLRPVINDGAVAMNELFPRAGNYSVGYSPRPTRSKRPGPELR